MRTINIRGEVRGCEYALAKPGAKVERYVVAASNDAKKEDG